VDTNFEEYYVSVVRVETYKDEELTRIYWREMFNQIEVMGRRK
jgi:hypothetical protein